ncbi:MAG: HEAT repeat domain-containing protein [Nitrospirae bacterium]|nr:MAG: HEAT repeat domain-containing protein [Nitrospirota bacterium]
MNTKRLRSLLKKLDSQNPAVRKEAAEALSEGDERAVYPLVKRLHDPVAGVQEAAMQSLIKIGGEATAYMVLPLLRENPAVRNMALLILKEICPVHLLGGLLKDRDDDVRKFAVDLIADTGDPEGVKYLMEVVNDPNPNVRAACYAAAGRLGAVELTDQLLRALDDQEWVAFSAIEALGRIRAEKAVPALMGALKSARSDTIKLGILDALGAIGEKRAAELLYGWAKEKDGFVGEAALKNLIRIGLDEEMKDLEDRVAELLDSPDRVDQQLGVKGIRELRGVHKTMRLLDLAGSLEQGIPEEQELYEEIRNTVISFGCTDDLVDAIASEELRYRGKSLAIEIAGELNCRRAVPELLRIIESPLRDLRRAGVRAIGEIGTIDDPSPLLRSASDPDGHVREAAVMALGGLGDKTVLDDLFELLEVEVYPNVREKIMGALVRLDEEEVRNRLNQLSQEARLYLAALCEEEETALLLTEDTEPPVRAQAALTLGRFGGKRVENRIVELSSDTSPEVRRSAVRAMLKLGCCKPAVISLLNDEDEWVRFHAIQALAGLNGEDLSKHLIKGLRDNAVTVVLKALDILSEFPSREAVQAVSELEMHPSEAVRKRAREILGR